MTGNIVGFSTMIGWMTAPNNHRLGKCVMLFDRGNSYMPLIVREGDWCCKALEFPNKGGGRRLGALKGDVGGS